MLNIVVPLAGKSIFFNSDEFVFPKPLIEIEGKPMIEHVVDNLMTIQQQKKFIFIVSKEDCDKFHLERVLSLLTKGEGEIIVLDSETRGAACSCLMAIDKIANGDKLVISNADQIIEVDLDKIIKDFEDFEYDAGVICIDSLLPRWSFVRTNEQNIVLEASEKKPLSRNAIAGFYYFREGKSFVKAAMDMIKSEDMYNNSYYIASSLNQLILQGKRIGSKKIPDAKYHSFYSPNKLEEFEKRNRCD